MRPLSGLALMLLSSLAAAEETLTFRWSREVEVPALTTTSLVAAPLDSQFFRDTREGYPDVRLRDDKGMAIGFVIRAASEMKPCFLRTTWTAQQMAAKVDAATGLQLELALREKELLPNGIRIITPLRDFEHQVQVESSADGRTWVPADPSIVIFDYSRHVDARNVEVPISSGDHRYFRITIQDVTTEQESQLLVLHRHLSGSEETDRTERTTINRVPFRIDRVEFYRDEPKVESGKLRMTAYPIEKFEITDSEKDHQTVLVVESRREPITEIKVLTSAENFSRVASVAAELEDDNGRMFWSTLDTGTLTRFSIGSIKKDELTLINRETRAPRYRIVVENRDSPGLPITGVELAGPQYELMFLAAAGQTLRLEYGSSKVAAGQFDTAALQAAIKQGQLPIGATLLAARENAGVESGRAWQPWNDSRVLVGSICLATALLGWGLFRASRNLTPPPAV